MQVMAGTIRAKDLRFAMDWVLAHRREIENEWDASTADEEMVVVGTHFPRIESVEFVDGFQVTYRLEEGKRAGQIEVVDLAPALFNHRLFAPLRSDPDLFSRVFVEHWGSALSGLEETWSFQPNGSIACRARPCRMTTFGKPWTP